MTNKNILVMASLDTKGEAVELLCEHIRNRGHNTIIMDLSMMKEPRIKADISAVEVAITGGGTEADTRGETGERDKRIEVLQKGAIKIISQMAEEGKIDGLISLGGATNTLMAANVSKNLPFGFPKLILSSTAGLGFNYFGRTDIALFATISDTDSMNVFLRNSVARAAYMICGAVESEVRSVVVEIEELRKADTRVIAMTQLFSAQVSAHTIDMLKQRGNYEVITFHSTGIGDMSMEELIEAGIKFDAILDICIAGLSEYLTGGNRPATATRLEAAGKRGIPQIITPTALDIISCGPLSRKDIKEDALWEKLRCNDRKLWVMDELRVQAKISAKEAVEIAEVIAGKLNRSKGPVKFLVPWKGWHTADREGQSLYQPEINKLLIDTLKKEIDPKVVDIREYDLYLNTSEFASVIVDTLEEILGKT